MSVTARPHGRIGSLIVFLLMINTAFFVAASGSAVALISGDYEYQLINGETEVEITGYHGPGGDVALPNIIDGMPVTSIGDWAFMGAAFTSLIISDSIRTIGYSSFIDCGFKSVTISGSVQVIGPYAFAYCHSLIDVNILDGLKKIEMDAFIGCTSLVTFTIPSTVTTIPAGPFPICPSLVEVLVDSNNPNFVSVDGVLYDATMTRVVQYPAGKSATTYTIPDSVTTIGYDSFSYSKLTMVIIPESVTFIGKYAFNTCPNLNNVILPNDLNTIDDVAFNQCTSLTSIVIPDSVTYLGAYSFHYCTALSSVTLSQGITNINSGAFMGCAALTSIIIPGSITRIGFEAFSGCTGLTSMTIPESVAFIDYVAFINCFSLNQMFFEGNAPTCDETSFLNHNADLVIYYYCGATGYTNPWYGVPTVCIPRNTLPTITGLIVPVNPIVMTAQAKVSATFTDPDVEDSHIAVWDWGDGTTSPGVVNEGTKTVTGTHTYSEPGIYTFSLTVTDSYGASATASAQTYLVVYDPAGGFVTGGGWFNSPAGAYKDDTSLSGKATFGFVAKYQKGASVPSGNTEFQFQMAGLNFHSASYQWLVVNQGGTNAQFKGDGTINGDVAPNGQNYKFMIWAGDHNPDTFRIKIWWDDSSGEHIIYDNGVQQAIAGGSIVIHTK